MTSPVRWASPGRGQLPPPATWWPAWELFAVVEAQLEAEEESWPPPPVAQRLSIDGFRAQTPPPKPLRGDSEGSKYFPVQAIGKYSRKSLGRNKLRK